MTSLWYLFSFRRLSLGLPCMALSLATPLMRYYHQLLFLGFSCFSSSSPAFQIHLGSALLHTTNDYERMRKIELDSDSIEEKWDANWCTSYWKSAGHYFSTRYSQLFATMVLKKRNSSEFRHHSIQSRFQTKIYFGRTNLIDYIVVPLIPALMLP